MQLSNVVWRRVLFATFTSFVWAHQALAEIRYEVVPIAQENLTLQDLTPSISNTGYVVGTSQIGGIGYGYIWKDGAIQLIQSSPGIGSAAYAVNDAGVVAGVTRGAGPFGGSIPRGFEYSGGAISILPEVKLAPSVNARAAYGINNAGVIVGEWETSGVKYDRGVATLLPAPMNAQGQLGSASARDINNQGWIVGLGSFPGSSAAVLWHDNTAFVLDALPLAPGVIRSSGAWAINDLNETAGFSRTTLASGSSFVHAVVWRNGTPTDLGTLMGSASNSTAYDINDNSDVVGWSTCGATGECAFIWSATEGMQKLDSLIDPTSGWRLLRATGINDSGWIVGFGTNNGIPTEFLLRPVPEPSSFSMGLIGLLVACYAQKKRSSAAPSRPPHRNLN